MCLAQQLAQDTCYIVAAIAINSCCSSPPSPPLSEIWSQNRFCTKRCGKRSHTGLFSSCIDILTLNPTTQFSWAKSQFSLPNPRHKTADMTWSFCGKGRKLHLKSIALFPSELQNPHRDPSGGSPGMWLHPRCGTSSLDSLSGCQPGAWEVPGPWFAHSPSPTSHMALWSALCPRESQEKCHDASRMVFPPPLPTKHVTPLFWSPGPWANCACYSRSWRVKHTHHTVLDAVRFIYENLFMWACSFCLPNEYIR